jgi:transposase
VVRKVRRKNGRNEETSLLIVDSQSVKNTDTAEAKGYDAGKKVSGIKRHIAVDSLGLPHGLDITTADIGDREGMLETLRLYRANLKSVKSVLADGGYTGEMFEDEVKKILGCPVQIAKKSECEGFVVIPKRWIVERSFAWLQKSRRLSKNCERHLNNSLNMTVCALLAVALKRL